MKNAAERIVKSKKEKVIMKPFNLLRKKRSISWILFFSLIHWLSSEGGKIDEVPVTLIGTVAIVQYYGPPNYGETPEIDSIEKHPVLTLHHPFVITIDGKELCIRSIQIIRSQRLMQFRFTEGRNYAIEGKIFLALTGHHHTEAVLFAESIKE